MYNNHPHQGLVQYKLLHHEDPHQVAPLAQDKNFLAFQLGMVELQQRQEDLSQFLNLNHVNQHDPNPPELSQQEHSHQEHSPQEPSLQFRLKQFNLNNQELNKDNRSELSLDPLFLLNNFLLNNLADQRSSNNLPLLEVYLNKLKLDSYPPQVKLFSPPLQSLKEAFKINQM